MTTQNIFRGLCFWLLMLVPYVQCYELAQQGSSADDAHGGASLAVEDRQHKAEVLGQWLRCVPYVEACVRDQLSRESIGFIPTIVRHACGSLSARIIAWCIAQVTGANPLYAPAEYKNEYPFWCVGYEFLAKNFLRYAIVGISTRAIHVHESAVGTHDNLPNYEEAVGMRHL